MQIQLGESHDIDLIQEMNEWCWKVDQGQVQADRGFTYREFWDLWNDHINEEDFILYPIYYFLDIKTVSQRAFFRAKYDYDVVSYEQALLDTNHGDLLKYLIERRRQTKYVPLSIFSRHLYTFGATRSGKSNFLRHTVYDIRKKDPKAAMVIIDPHGPLAKDVYWSDQTTGKNTVYCDIDFREGWTYKLNIFDLPDRNPKTIRFSKEVILSVLMEIADVSHQQQSILQACVNYIYTIEQPTFDDFIDLLDQKPSAIEKAAAYDPRFGDDFLKGTNATIRGAIRRRFNNLLDNGSLEHILKGHGTVKLNEQINKGRTIIFDLSGFPPAVSTPDFGKLLLAHIENIASSRDPSKGWLRPLYLVIDECHVFITGAYERFLAQMAKYGVRVILANQYIDQIREPYSKMSIYKNVGTKVGWSKKMEDFEGLISVPDKFVDGKRTKLMRFQFLVENESGTYPFKTASYLLNGKHTNTPEEQENIDTAIRDRYYVPIETKEQKRKQSRKQQKPPNFTTDLYLGNEE